MYVHFRPEDLWSIYFQFPGKKYALVKMSEREITYGSLVNVMVSNGYCKDDSLCYLKEEDIGLQGVCVIKGNIEVVHMLRQFESTQTLSLTVIKGKVVIEPPIGEDQDAQQIDVEPPVVFAVAESGGVHKLVPPNCQLHLGTQESVNFLPLKSVPPNCQLHLGTQLNTEVSVNYADFQFDSDEEDNAVSEEGSSSDEDFVVDVDHLDAGEEEDDSDSVQYVEEQIAKRRTEEPELDETLSEIKRKRAEYMSSTHCEGDTDPEDIYDMEQEEDDEEAQEIPVPEPVKKKAKRPGPTSRSHSSAGPTINPDWFPSSEEEDTGFEADDDGNEPMSFVISSGRRSRAKKRPPRVWYDEDRMHPEQQFQLKLCFKDVYQFREALVNLHVKQLRRYKYHRNCSDRIIV